MLTMDRSRSRLSLFFLRGVCYLSALLFVLSFLIPDAILRIEKDTIGSESGCCYVVALPAKPRTWPLFVFRSDSDLAPTRSGLRLFQDSEQLGPPHSLHQVIRQEGTGHFSHWNSLLYFSTPNCSDPALSDKELYAHLPRTVPPWIRMPLLAMALFLLVLDGRLRRLVLRFQTSWIRILSFLFTPTSPVFRRPWSVLILLVLVASAQAYLGWGWITDRTYGLSLAGRYQISDAMGYWTCGNALLDQGHFGNPQSFTHEWCQRRAIYPTLLAGLAWVGQRNILLTLSVQAVFVSVAIFFATRCLTPHFGLLSFLGSSVLLFIFATFDTFTVTMTENAGLILGCLAFLFLVKSAGRLSLLHYFIGASFLSLALNARAGAFLIIPALAIWAASTAYVAKRGVIVWIGASVFAAVIGFIVQAALVISVGGTPGSSHGNFAYVLYGLSVGGLGWERVVIDHPELSGTDAQVNRAIYDLAIANIKASPTKLLDGLKQHFAIFLDEGAYGYSRLGSFAPYARLIWWVGLIPLILNIRRPVGSLLLLSSVGIICSSPFIIRDGGPRVFAATMPFITAQMMAGIWWAGYLLLNLLCDKKCKLRWSFHKSEDSAGKSTISYAEVGLAALVLCLLCYPVLRTPRIDTYPVPGNSSDCSPSSYSVVTRLGSSRSMLLNLLAESGQPSHLHEEANRESFISKIPSDAWYRQDLQQFPAGGLLAAYQLNASDPMWPGPYLTILNTAIRRDDYGKTALLCLSKQQHRRVHGNTYFSVDSISVLE